METGSSLVELFLSFTQGAGKVLARGEVRPLLSWCLQGLFLKRAIFQDLLLTNMELGGQSNQVTVCFSAGFLSACKDPEMVVSSVLVPVSSCITLRLFSYAEFFSLL